MTYWICVAVSISIEVWKHAHLHCSVTVHFRMNAALRKHLQVGDFFLILSKSSVFQTIRHWTCSSFFFKQFEQFWTNLSGNSFGLYFEKTVRIHLNPFFEIGYQAPWCQSIYSSDTSSVLFFFFQRESLALQPSSSFSQRFTFPRLSALGVRCVQSDVSWIWIVIRKLCLIKNSPEKFKKFFFIKFFLVKIKRKNY